MMFKPPAYYKTRLWVAHGDENFIFDVDAVDFQAHSNHPWTAPKTPIIKTTILVNSWEWKSMMEWWADVQDAVHTGGKFKREGVLVFKPVDTVENWKVKGLWPLAYEADHDILTVTLVFDTIHKMDSNGKPTPEQLTEKTLAKYGVQLVT